MEERQESAPVLFATRDSPIRPMNALFGKRRAPDEVLAPSHDEEYITYRKLTDFREPYRSVFL